MPTVTRSQVRARQPLVLTASSRANTPGRVSRSQQAPCSGGIPNRSPRKTMKAGVRSRSKDCGGDLSTSLAEGTTIPAGSRNCRSDCKTCPDLITNEEFISNVTGRKYKTKNNTTKKITCKLQNYVYLLTCKSCNVQYVGESAIGGKVAEAMSN